VVGRGRNGGTGALGITALRALRSYGASIKGSDGSRTNESMRQLALPTLTPEARGAHAHVGSCPAASMSGTC
jgi:hypothetical protein